MKRILFFWLLLPVSVYCTGQEKKTQVPVNSPGSQFELTGQLGLKMGTTLTVRGFIVEGPFKGYEGGLNLVVQMINDSAVQQLIQIPVSPYHGEFSGISHYPGAYTLPKLIHGKTYRFRVYETGGFVGTPGMHTKRRALFFQMPAFISATG